MPNNETFLDETNYDDVFLRDVIKGFKGFLFERFKWVNKTENGPVIVKIPFYYSLTGDNRYIMDAFFDDVPQTRVNMNTDQIPRASVTLTSWAVKSDEFTNPNVWINVNKLVDGELSQSVMQTKAVPLKLTFTIDTVLDSELDIFKSWQTYMDNMFIYRYFTFTYARLPINAVFNFKGDTDNQMVRDFKFGDVNAYKTQHTIEIHTFYPIFDLEHKFLANKAVDFILKIWQDTNVPNIPVNGSSN